ncbi:MAG: transcriptional repressor [Candidatus Eremiobacteraeota bacterium]|nr:transcriptional repressor [Candidatus Eremiobacteraeota bacterium]
MSESALAALPKNYRLVYDIVLESGLGLHLTTHEIVTRTRERRPKTGFSTVYRALARLRDLGLVAEIIVPGSDSATYEPIGDDHAHFHCRHCGRIQDVPFTVPAETLANLSASTGLGIEFGVVTFTGSCVTCAGALRPPAATSLR